MKITTRVFGEIEIDESKIIHFPSGIIGFPEMTDFVLVFDEEKGKDTHFFSRCAFMCLRRNKKSIF